VTEHLLITVTPLRSPPADEAVDGKCVGSALIETNAPDGAEAYFRVDWGDDHWFDTGLVDVAHFEVCHEYPHAGEWTITVTNSPGQFTWEPDPPEVRAAKRETERQAAWEAEEIEYDSALWSSLGLFLTARVDMDAERGHISANQAEAKRELIKAYEYHHARRFRKGPEGWGDQAYWGWWTGFEAAFKLWSAEYRDHPDWDEDWNWDRDWNDEGDTP
jgi:hypothetical protein